MHALTSSISVKPISEQDISEKVQKCDILVFPKTSILKNPFGFLGILLIFSGNMEPISNHYTHRGADSDTSTVKTDGQYRNFHIVHEKGDSKTLLKIKTDKFPENSSR